MLLTHKIHWQYGCYGGYVEDSVEMADDDESDESVFMTQAFWVFEGNFSCDCNRSIFWVTLWGCLDCGDDIILNRVEFYRDGRFIGVSSDNTYDCSLGY
jgi:hypothetical protein